ncbi:MAG TPA: DUF1631 family protein, partial [Burkholderiaceae bacterium]
REAAPAPAPPVREPAQDATARPSAQRAPPAPAGTGTGHALDLAAQAADVARTLGTSPLAASDGGPRLTVLPTLQPVVELERDAVAFAHSIGAVPYSHEARVGFFGNVRTRLRAANAPPSQLALVDVVAAMFDYVIDDRRVPEAVKPLIWRLQQPTVALSLLDPAFLGDEPRSLRRLIENLGAIANAFADDFARGGELHRRIDTVVRAVEIVASALQTRSAVMARQVLSEHQRASRNVVQLIERVVQERSSLEATPDKRNRRDYRRRPDAEQEREVTARLTGLLNERIDRHRVPDSVREFVLNVWLRHLRSAVLRTGEESDEFRLALQVVDDLLWSLDSGRERQSRRELAQRIPTLIGMLTQGLRSVGAKDDEFKAFFDELFLIHLRKMQRRGRSGDSQPGSRVPAGARTRSGPRTGTRAGPAERGGANRLDSEIDTLLDELPAPRRGGGEAGGEVPAIADLASEPGPADAGRARPEPAQAEPPSTEHKLLEVLSSLDLGDLPGNPRPVDETPERAFGALSRGDWLRITGRDGSPVHAKVAWINARRTVVLMVRHPDRRALSMRAAELIDRLRSGRARRVH